MRDGVITLLEAWVQVSSPDRILPALADYLTSPKAAMAEGKVSYSPSHQSYVSVLFMASCSWPETDMKSAFKA